MLKVDNESRDLGYLKFGQPVSFKYTISNDSNRDIMIDNVVVSCGSCTVAKASNLRVQSHAKETISVTFTPGTVGKQKKYIDVIYEGKTLRLLFNAESHG